MLFSLEGQKGVVWEKILKLQCEDGSIFYSPAATAYAYIHTRDENCLKYLTDVVEKFNGGGKFFIDV